MSGIPEELLALEPPIAQIAVQTVHLEDQMVLYTEIDPFEEIFDSARGLRGAKVGEVAHIGGANPNVWGGDEMLDLQRRQRVKPETTPKFSSGGPLGGIHGDCLLVARRFVYATFPNALPSAHGARSHGWRDSWQLRPSS